MPSASSVEKKQSNLLDQVQAKTADRFKKDKTGKSFEDTRMDSTKRTADRYKKLKVRSDDVRIPLSAFRNPTSLPRLQAGAFFSSLSPS